MSKQTEAMKLALERLQSRTDTADLDAIAALNVALASEALDRMADNARELGLDYEPAQQSAERGEPVAYGMWDTMLGKDNRMMMVRLDKGQDGCTVPLYTAHGITSGEATKKGNT